jgi:two-component system, NtrC family, nitrogen regulation sensor histidine kinase GlnL
VTGRRVVALHQPPPAGVDAEQVLNALASVVVVVDANGAIVFVNGAGEHFFKAGAANLVGQPLHDLLPADSPLFFLVDQARGGVSAVSEHGMTLRTPRIGAHTVNVQAAVLPEDPSRVAILLHQRSVADRMEGQLSRRGAARSLSAMAAMLAHEVKNPLSGIRGAAQLLESNVTAEDRALAELIRDESDRICALVERVEAFSDSRPLPRRSVNIHQVLDRVRRLAETGFGRHIRFVERYDPSLPPVSGDHDQLVQVFLNLVKNAAEAVPDEGGEIALTTTYRHNGRFAVPGEDTRIHLPLMVGVRDNGDGIPEDLRSHLFDPFVTSKSKGSGLGLALVAKIVGDHGGVIEFESQPRRTTFRVMLPMAGDGEGVE